MVMLFVKQYLMWNNTTINLNFNMIEKETWNIFSIQTFPYSVGLIGF